MGPGFESQRDHLTMVLALIRVPLLFVKVPPGLHSTLTGISKRYQSNPFIPVPIPVPKDFLVLMVPELHRSLVCSEFAKTIFHFKTYQNEPLFSSQGVPEKSKLSRIRFPYFLHAKAGHLGYQVVE